MYKACKTHSEVVNELLRKDAAFEVEYLKLALDEIDEPGGRESFLTTLHRIAKANRIATEGKPVDEILFSVLKALRLRVNLQHIEEPKAA
jgi:hypothetical protein